MNSRPDVNTDRSTQFIELLTGHQRKLYGYIATMLGGDPSSAADVLQETNLELWARLNDYDFDRPFLSWAFGFARIKVFAHRRSYCRSRLIFGEEALELIDDACAKFAAQTDERLVALQKCLKKLKPQQAELIRLRYAAKTPVKTLAVQFDDSVQNVSSRLHRIRKLLGRCIAATLALENQ